MTKLTDEQKKDLLVGLRLVSAASGFTICLVLYIAALVYSVTYLFGAKSILGALYLTMSASVIISSIVLGIVLRGDKVYSLISGEKND